MPRHRSLIAIALAFAALAVCGEAEAQYWVRPYPRDFAYAYPYPYPYPYRYGPGPGYVVPAYPYRYPPPVVVERYYVAPQREPRAPQYSFDERQPRRAAPIAERITLSANELFAFDSARLRSPQPRLDEIADALESNPQIGKVRITGYTDRLGSEGYNLKLSQMRANAVKDYLVAKGVAAQRLVAGGRGEANPVVRCGDTNRAELIRCLEPNRRVEVEPITFPRR